MTAAAPPWSEMVKYDLNTGDIVWRIPTGVQEAPPEYNIPNNTGVQFPRNAPLVTAGGLIFLATGPERKVHAYDRDNGKELWQHSLPNGAEGMPATYQVNGRQFVVPGQPNGTLPASFRGGRLPHSAAPAAAAPAPAGRPKPAADPGPRRWWAAIASRVTSHSHYRSSEVAEPSGTDPPSRLPGLPELGERIYPGHPGNPATWMPADHGRV